MSRRRGLTMLETVTALTLSVGLALMVTPLVLQDLRAVTVARDELRAREALQSLKDRAQVGALRLPSDLSAPRDLPSDLPGIALQVERVEAVDARITTHGLRAVRLVARWTDQDGQTGRRALVVLVQGGRP